MNIHILGIAGSMTAPLALALAKEGHLVTGSDQDKIFPPFSTQLKKAKIKINQTPITSNIDLAIIGSSYLSFSKTKQEYQEILRLGISYISATNYISQNLIKKNSILIAGTYGKTTITAATAYLLEQAGLKPAFMFGGQSKNSMPSLKFSDSNWSVVEADESINGLDTMAKFLYYRGKILILTSANWEHKESYPSPKDNFEAFKKLIISLPQDGLLIYNQNEKSLESLLEFCPCQKIAYSKTNISNLLVGDYNQNNLAAVETLGKYLKIDEKIIKDSFIKFKGVKRRLELIATKYNIQYYDDFAQSSDRIKAALSSLKSKYPDSRIKVFYEPHASFLQNRTSLQELSTSFSLSDETVIYRLKYQSQNRENRLSAKDFLELIPRSLYLPLPDLVIKHYQNLKPGDILIHFSSGGLEGLKILKKVISLVKS